MAEEKDIIGRDEPLNEEAPTPQTAGDAADAAPAADAPARAGKFDRLTQDERTRIIAQLHEQGMFELRGAVQFTVKKLSCSQASIYRYIKKAKAGENAQNE